MTSTLDSARDALPFDLDLEGALDALQRGGRSLPSLPFEITPKRARAALMGLRASLAVGVWVAPVATGRLFGLDPEENRGAPYLGRLFGVREGALVAELALASPERVTAVAQRHILVDAADVVAAAVAGVRGQLPKRAAVMAAATAGLAVYLGVVASRD